MRLGAAANHAYARLARSLERLSTGLRINSGADDPAGIVISENLRSQIASLSQEIDNISGLVSKYTTADSGIGELRSYLHEMRSLALGAANAGGNSEVQQQAYHNSAVALAEAYNNTIEKAQFNGSNLLDGSDGAVATVAAISGIDLSSAGSAENSIAIIDAAMANLDFAQARIGSTQKYDLEARQRSLEVTRQNLIAAESQIRDADFANHYSISIGESIRLQSTLALLAHSSLGAQSVLKLLE